MKKSLRAKDLDGYISFLRRLNTIGKNIAIVNDIIICCSKYEGDKRVIGRHIIRDPFFIDDEEAYVYKLPYYMKPIDVLTKEILKVTTMQPEDLAKSNGKETESLDYDPDKVYKNKAARSKITLVRTKYEYYLYFDKVDARVDIGIPITTIQHTITKDTPSDARKMLNEIEYNTSALEYFDEFIDVESLVWDSITTDELIDIRNGLPVSLYSTNDEIDTGYMWARIAKSVFTMAGVTRMNTPIAEMAKYTFLYSPKRGEDVGILRLHCKYKSPSSSTVIVVECIHEYAILVCNP